MRRLMMAVAITAVAGAGSLMTSGAQALPGASALQGAADTGLVEKTQVVCPRPYWNGWRWVQPPCRPMYAPRVYAPIGPPVVVVKPWRRPRYYYY
jgi:hypothetical protein